MEKIDRISERVFNTAVLCQLRATAHAADPWSVPGAGGYRIEEFFFGPMAIHAHIDRHITYPCQAKPGPTKCFPLALEPIINSSPFVRHPSCGRSSETIGASPLEAGSETPEQQQDSSPCQAKRSPTKCFPVPLEPIKNSSFVRHPRCEAGSQTIGARPLEAEIRQNA